MFAVFAMIPAVSPVSSLSATSRPNSANRDGDREKDQKNVFMVLKLSLLLARLRLPNRGLTVSFPN